MNILKAIWQFCSYLFVPQWGTKAMTGNCLGEQKYGIQIPKGVWHSIVVHEPSTIFEAKDGAYGK